MKCNRLALCAYCLLLALPLGAQVNVRYEKKEKGVYEFIGENNLNIPVSVFVRFTDLQGFTGYLPSGRPYVLNSGSKTLFRLTPRQGSNNYVFRYNYSWRKGDFTEKPDTAFVYLPPVRPGKTVVVQRGVTLKGFIDRKVEEKEKAGLSFHTEEGDTIYAMRKGVVTDVVDHKASKGKGVIYNDTENYVRIYHEDNTFMTYSLLQNDGIFVQPGETVLPGQPIGLAGGTNYRSGSRLHVSLYGWLPATEEDNVKDLVYHRAYRLINPYLYGVGKVEAIKGGVSFPCEHPLDIITQEMSKREIKKYKKEHGLQ